MPTRDNVQFLKPDKESKRALTNFVEKYAANELPGISIGLIPFTFFSNIYIVRWESVEAYIVE